MSAVLPIAREGHLRRNALVNLKFGTRSSLIFNHDTPKTAMTVLGGLITGE